MDTRGHPFKEEQEGRESLKKKRLPKRRQTGKGPAQKYQRTLKTKEKAGTYGALGQRGAKRGGGNPKEKRRNSGKKDIMMGVIYKSGRQAKKKG